MASSSAAAAAARVRGGASSSSQSVFRNPLYAQPVSPIGPSPRPAPSVFAAVPWKGGYARGNPLFEAVNPLLPVAWIRDNVARVMSVAFGSLRNSLIAAVVATVVLTTLLLTSMRFEKPLIFDYREAAPSAVATFLPPKYLENNQIKPGTPPTVRFLPAGQLLDVSVALNVPETPENRQLGLFQVTAQLLTADGQVLVSGSRPCLLRFRSGPIHYLRTMLFALPMAFGYFEEQEHFELKLLSRYKEKADKPFVKLQVKLEHRAGSCLSPPIVSSASTAVERRLTGLSYLMYYWRFTCMVWGVLSIFSCQVLMLLCICPRLLLPLPAPEEAEVVELEAVPVAPTRLPTVVLAEAAAPAPASELAPALVTEVVEEEIAELPAVAPASAPPTKGPIRRIRPVAAPSADEAVATAERPNSSPAGLPAGRQGDVQQQPDTVPAQVLRVRHRSQHQHEGTLAGPRSGGDSEPDLYSAQEEFSDPEQPFNVGSVDPQGSSINRPAALDDTWTLVHMPRGNQARRRSIAGSVPDGTLRRSTSAGSDGGGDAADRRGTLDKSQSQSSRKHNGKWR
eukprot:jgi/Chlat1/7321/Chrsp58S06937